MQSILLIACTAVTLTVCSCQSSQNKTQAAADSAAASQPPQRISTGEGDTVTLPPPFQSKSVKNFSHVISWPQGQMPVAPPGFTVNRYVVNIKSPRWLYVLPNGDVLAALANTESKGIKAVKDITSGKIKSEHTDQSANVILLFRGLKNGVPEVRDTFLTGLNQPFGMLLIGNNFYVANTDAVWRYPYTSGQTKITAKGQKIMDVPPAGYNNHWTRNIITNADQSKLFVTVGSGSNAGEHGVDKEVHRANILQANPDGSDVKVYASGLRNPNGMAWAPGTNTLWTVVNERDELGDDLVPDYFTSVKEGGFYGWPFSYYGQHIDPRIPAKEQRPDLVKTALVPDVPLGSHTASLGLVFYTAKAFPDKYQGGAFIGQHGSWNRSQLAGYRVVYVPFKNGKPSGRPEDFLTGFIGDTAKSEVYGRPVGVAVMNDGSMLVADDAGDVIWRVSASSK
ncbi:PQQ-dependent sugar dehydrogenase [Deminuibacter soli]|uniref:Sorbosone dehydrogenase family protein n=1 Tax=Deminuibacter soli TaxID=2291815 RepID=A0A3E1NHN8_9BACT|nr:sorbosone dehydrogenase family protein [Deminuibacter soli]RFM27381.1 sorbosone dehydrogenase family protein [Deminuibacter soli]